MSPKLWRVMVSLFILVIFLAQASAADNSRTSDTVLPPLNVENIKLPVIERNDIRFKRLSNPQDLSQVRVSNIVQDNQGFLWFGTWNCLNRYDGYKFKVFWHEAGRTESLIGSFIYSLFKDRSGSLWVGSDQFLDRFDPLTEKFVHYRLDSDNSEGSRVTVNQISQDSAGMLWLSTRHGLFRLNPDTGELANYCHNPGDPSSLSDNDIKSTGEDRAGAFWVGTSQTLDEFDRQTGKVKRHIVIGESGIGLWFHEDRFGVFWVICHSEGQIAALDRKTNRLIRYQFDWGNRPGKLNSQAYALLEDRQGTMWFGTGAGLLKFDREHRRFISYNHRPGDSDSLADTRVIALFEDHEGNIWTGLHQVEPNFFANTQLPFERLTHDSGNPRNLSPGLVGTLYEDRHGILWVGVDRSLKQVNRKTGQYSVFKPAAGSEVLSIIEERPDILWLGNAGPGLLRYDRKTGNLRGYRHDPADPASLCSGIVQRLLIDHRGTLWAATWDGLCRFDSSSQRFTTYKPDPKNRGLNYYAIAEDGNGDLWLGGNLGLHRFNTKTNQFTVYNHNLDDSTSLSDNRVNSIYFDHTGTMWVGTQNGLNRFNSKTNTFTVYDERHGMAGNVVSCILQDQRDQLWMSTNKGVSSFRPITERFANYTAADGLPGPDLTGWGACFQSAAGEMFFGGFSGVTAFFPDKVRDSTYSPPAVLTDFRLFGIGVTPEVNSPLKRAINHTSAIKLSHEQNVFSIEFSALTYFNTATNRYRYKLEGLDRTWHEVGSDERLASYTTLPTGTYTFRLQAATSRGPWSAPGLALVIEILPPFWKTAWFLIACTALVGISLWVLYQVRLRQIAHQFHIRLEERVGERMRIAQELHDTLLQNVTGLSLQIGGLAKVVTAPESVKRRLQDLKRQAEDCLREARQSVWDIRSPESDTIDLAAALRQSGEQFVAGTPARFAFHLEGEPRPIEAEVCQQLLRIGREAMGNAAHHAESTQMEVHLQFEARAIRLRISDNGRGFDPQAASRLPGHFGLATMRERARRIQGSIEISSTVGQGTCIEVIVPCSDERQFHDAFNHSHSCCG